MDSIKLSSQGERGLKMFVDITISVPKTSHTKIQKSLAATDRERGPTDRERDFHKGFGFGDGEVRCCVVSPIFRPDVPRFPHSLFGARHSGADIGFRFLWESRSQPL